MTAVTRQQRLNAMRRLERQLAMHRNGTKRMSKSDFKRGRRDIQRYRDALNLELDEEYDKQAERLLDGGMTDFWNRGTDIGATK